MSQIFHRSANTIARVSIFGAVFFVAGLGWLFSEVNRSPWSPSPHVAREQPSSSATSGTSPAAASTAATATPRSRTGVRRHSADQDGMNCHSQIRTVRFSSRCATASAPESRSLDARARPPDSSTSTSIHVNKGVSCTVPRPGRSVPLMQEESLQVEWCLGCHRNPEQTSARAGAVFSVDYTPPADRMNSGSATAPQIQKLHGCSTCHR